MQEKKYISEKRDNMTREFGFDRDREERKALNSGRIVRKMLFCLLGPLRNRHVVHKWLCPMTP